MRPILVTGKMGSGKTSIANRIIAQYSYPKVSMADWIKHTVEQHYGLDGIDKSITIKDKPMRTYLQEVGKYMRMIDSDWHIDEVINKINLYKLKQFIIDDIRFINEAEKVCQKYNCLTIKVECDERKRLERLILRDMIVPTESQLKDVSEIEIDDIHYDYIVNNNGTIDELFDQVDRVIRSDQNESTKVSNS